jgi:hypothetical protein
MAPPVSFNGFSIKSYVNFSKWSKMETNSMCNEELLNSNTFIKLGESSG